jgi:DNA-directed RNA polymerase subunit RPC12/RpoP
MSGDKKDFKCLGCGYKFKKSIMDREATIRCPYCGSKDVEEYKAVMASDLLNSVKGDDRY